MDVTVSKRLEALRQKFRQFEHGGNCFTSEDIFGITAELGALSKAARTLELNTITVPPAGMPQRPKPGQAPRPQPHAGAIAIGTLYFEPAGRRLS